MGRCPEGGVRGEVKRRLHECATPRQRDQMHRLARLGERLIGSAIASTVVAQRNHGYAMAKISQSLNNTQGAEPYRRRQIWRDKKNTHLNNCRTNTKLRTSQYTLGVTLRCVSAFAPAVAQARAIARSYCRDNGDRFFQRRNYPCKYFTLILKICKVRQTDCTKYNDLQATFGSLRTQSAGTPTLYYSVLTPVSIRTNCPASQLPSARSMQPLPIKRKEALLRSVKRKRAKDEIY